LDEAGSRVHITNIDVPEQILELEKKLEAVKETKNSVVKKQKYEEAAKLRDDEKRLEKELAICSRKMGRRNQTTSRNCHRRQCS
jgi:ATP-dependent Clp protease ATP-binding subunit ClpC